MWTSEASRAKLSKAERWLLAERVHALTHSEVPTVRRKKIEGKRTCKKGHMFAIFLMKPTR